MNEEEEDVGISQQYLALFCLLSAVLVLLIGLRVEIVTKCYSVTVIVFIYQTLYLPNYEFVFFKQ